MSTITERGRHQLYEQVEASWGKEVADTLMALLPPVGWAEVATKSDIDSLRTEIDSLRTEMTAMGVSLKGEISYESARLLRIFVTANIVTVLAVCGMAFGIARSVG